MKKIKVLILILFLGIFLLSCEKNNDNSNDSNCSRQVIVSKNAYDTYPTDDLTINSMELKGDCLRINFTAVGCNGSSWIVKLCDSEAIMESMPPQRNLILSLKNDEMCYGFATREISFDISPLQVDGNHVILNITNTGDEFLYEY